MQGGGAVSDPDTSPTLSVRQRIGRRMRVHWRRVAGAVLIGVGLLIGFIAKNSLFWWSVAAVCAGLGALAQFYPGHQPTTRAAATTAPAPVPGRERPGRVWNILAPVRSFTGRDSLLAALRKQLEAGQRTARVPAAALYGMGGIGKTQLARAYAHHYRDRYQLGWWIPAEPP
jgi:hypothetical protein